MDAQVAAALKRAKFRARAQKFFGWTVAGINSVTALLGVTFMFMGYSFFDLFDAGMRLTFAGLTAVAVLLILLGTRKAKLIKLYPTYSARLAADSEKSVARLANYINVPVAEALKNLQGMIDLGFFPNCVLDRQRNRLVTSQRTVNVNTGGQAFSFHIGHGPADPQETVEQVKNAMDQMFTSMNEIFSSMKQNQTAQPQSPQIVTCPHCGGVNKIAAGTKGQCEFCGRQISV